jgi:hypothetical protein
MSKRVSRQEQLAGIAKSTKTKAGSKTKARSVSPPKKTSKASGLDFSNRGLAWWSPAAGDTLFADGKFKIVKEIDDTGKKSKTSAQQIKHITAAVARNKWWGHNGSHGHVDGNKTFVFNTHLRARMAGALSDVAAVINHYYDSKKKLSSQEETDREAMLKSDNWIQYDPSYDEFKVDSKDNDIRKQANLDFKNALFMDPALVAEAKNFPDLYREGVTASEIKHQEYDEVFRKILAFKGVKPKDIKLYTIKKGKEEEVKSKATKKRKTKTEGGEKKERIHFGKDDTFAEKFAELVAYNDAHEGEEKFFNITDISEEDADELDNYQPGPPKKGSADEKRVKIVYISNFPVASQKIEDYDIVLKYLQDADIIDAAQAKKFKKVYKEKFDAIETRLNASQKKNAEKKAAKPKGTRAKKTVVKKAPGKIAKV